MIGDTGWFPKRKLLEIAGALLMLACGSAGIGRAQNPPPTARDDVVDVLHGVAVRDPYRWLEDNNSPETRAWIAAQDQYTHPVIDHLPGGEALRARLARLMKVDSTGMPTVRNDRYFFMKRGRDQDLFAIYVRQGFHGNDRLLIDPGPMSRDHSISADLLGVSRDGEIMIYGVRRGGQDQLAVHLFDVTREKDLPDALPSGRYFGLSLTPDNHRLYYCVQQPAGPRAFYHTMGTPFSQDAEIFGKQFGPTDIMTTRVSEDGRYLLIDVSHGSSGDNDKLYDQDLGHHGRITPIVDDIRARFVARFAGSRLIIETNWNAPRGRLFAADLSNPSRARWRLIIPQGADPIDGVAAVGGRIFVNYLHDVTSRLSVYDLNGRRLASVALPVLGSVGAVRGQWEAQQAFFNFSSFVFPDTVYRYTVSDGKEDIWSREKIPIESGRFDIRQVWYTSKDGTRVPMFLVYPKGLKLNGKNPALMTAYGGFDVSLTPQFSVEAAAWVENGGVFALPNLRGGGEFGEKWHQAGMLGNKQNVFDDFFAAAEWLIRRKYTEPDKLAITGASNGGLLMGAAMTQRPGLFRAVVCRYPLLDMIRYQNFLVAKFWAPEYGSSANPEQFRYLIKYSPYQNVKAGTKYPAVLFVSGDGDTRVAPLHARKMTAMMQWATDSGRPVLLDYDTASGRSGGRPLGKQINETAEEMLFMFWQLGVTVR